MKYMMMVCVDPTENVEPDSGGYTIEQWVEEMDGGGVRLLGDRLRPPTDATTVRVRGGELLLTDGPFVESKEALGGYYLVEAADLDEAIALAKQVPVVKGGLEVRPILVFS